MPTRFLTNTFHAVNVMLKKSVFIFFLFAQLMLWMPKVHAADAPCSITSGMNFAPVVGTSVFPRDAALGTLSAPYVTMIGLSCTDDTVKHTVGTYTGPTGAVSVPGFTNVFQTNVPGVGVQYTLENGAGTSCRPYSGNFPVPILSSQRTFYCDTSASTKADVQTFIIKYTAYFVKTAITPIGTLTTIPSIYLQAYLDGGSSIKTLGNIFSGAASGTFAIAACTVSTPSIAVTMPKTYTSRLPNVGSTDGETSLNIDLNCDAGVKVYTTLTDVSTPLNTSTTLSLSPDSTAQGIGYQILYNGTLVKLGVDSSVPGNPGQFVLTPTQTTGGVLSVPLTARYIRTGKIGTGSVNGKATFTMSYQ